MNCTSNIPYLNYTIKKGNVLSFQGSSAPFVGRLIDINLEYGENCVIHIENTAVYSRLLADLYRRINGEEGDLQVYDGDKRLDLKKYSELILEPFTIDLNSKKIKSKLYQELMDISVTELYSDYMDICIKIKDFMNKICSSTHYSVVCNQDISVEDILKLSNVEMYYPYENVVERLFNYVHLLSASCGIKVVFIVDPGRYMSDDEIKELVKAATYDNIKLVIICTLPANFVGEGLKRYYFDKDLCFWQV